MSFQDAVARGIDLSGSLAVVGVDSAPGRIAASVYYRERHTPVIFAAVSENANHGSVFVQEPGGACFACLDPESVNDHSSPCPGTPAMLDILKVVAGIAVYAVDTTLMPRPRLWNYKAVYLDGSAAMNWKIARRANCQLCGLRHDEPQTEGRR